MSKCPGCGVELLDGTTFCPYCGSKVVNQNEEQQNVNQEVFENVILQPAFGSAFTALFGALAYKYFIKDPLLVPIPFALCILSSFLKLGTGVSILIGGVAAIIMAVLISKRDKKKTNK